MHVTMVVPDLAPTSGGPAENVPRLAVALAQRGLRVEVEATGPVPSLSAPHLQLHGAAPAWPRRLGRSPDLAARLRRASTDLIHSHCLWMLPLHYAAAAARRQGVPLVISARGMLAPWSLARSRINKRLARWFIHPGALELAAGWHATSQAEADDIRQLGFMQPICVAPNGIEPSDQDAEAARRFYASAAPEIRGRRVLLFYSRFHSKKRVLELMQVFSALTAEHGDWHLLMVGIPEEYGIEDLQAEARRLGVARQVSVVDGRDAPKPYPVSELFVLPTHNENFGRVVAEALAAGVPVLTTTETPWGEINAIDAGACVAIEDLPKTLQEFMRRDPESLRTAGCRGTEWVLANFDWSQIAECLEGFYRHLLAGQGHDTESRRRKR